MTKEDILTAVGKGVGWLLLIVAVAAAVWMAYAFIMWDKDPANWGYEVRSLAYLTFAGLIGYLGWRSL